MIQEIIQPEAEPIDARYVQTRVEDWVSRLDALYSDLTAWLPPGYRAEHSQGVTMNEEMMRKYGVQPRQLPVLNVFEGEAWKAKVIPFGLWVIGANGRLDVLVGDKKKIIVGGERGEEVPTWRIASNDGRSALKGLTRESWIEALQ
ncbi:hypothetical protein [Methylorubrum aminovorans]|nr:hypothetical protein [Methylorubrum aminovorans]GMA79904.1 hypothetical protein GCM10025880_63210 [Methylorubrum aminovorans]